MTEKEEMDDFVSSGLIYSLYWFVLAEWYLGWSSVGDYCNGYIGFYANQLELFFVKFIDDTYINTEFRFPDESTYFFSISWSDIPFKSNYPQSKKYNFILKVNFRCWRKIFTKHTKMKWNAQTLSVFLHENSSDQSFFFVSA